MSKTFLAGFLARGVVYEHKIDSATGETYVVNGATGAPVYFVNQGGWVYNRHGALAGRFRADDSGSRYYEAIDASIRMNTKCEDPPKAERDVFRRLISLGYLE